ncbi:MAG TPA: hypothetical protein VLB86_07580 [Gaiellaceae bacterium]|nr:hypothetical protein [Gaiellaceae bacterium]
MVIRPNDPALTADLLSFLRSSGCIAYYRAASDTIEAISPASPAADEEAELRALLEEWVARNDGVTLETDGLS